MGRKNKHANKNKAKPPAARDTDPDNKHMHDDEQLPPAPADEDLDVDYQHYSSADDDADGAAPPTNPSRKRQRGNGKTSAKQNGGPGQDDEDDEDDDDESEDDEDDDEQEAEIQLKDAAEEESDVEVTLDFYDPTEADARTLLGFLGRWVHRTGAGDTGAIVDLIVAQTRVGTTVRVDENDAPVAFITALNVRRHKPVLKDVLKRIAKHGGDGSDGGGDDDNEGNTADGDDAKKGGDGRLLARTVRKCMNGDGRFESEKMGLVLWERVVNLPPLVLPKMMEALFCEVEWAVEDEPTAEGREDFRMGWFLYVTEVLVGPAVPDGAEAEDRPVGASKKKKQKTKDTPAEPEINFTRAEDEAWYEFAADTVAWPISGAEKEKGGVERRGMAMLLAAAKVPAMRKRVEEMVGFVEEATEAEAGAEVEVEGKEDKAAKA